VVMHVVTMAMTTIITNAKPEKEDRLVI
jgi:hypothetical protein